jgi:hypothetical protein
MFAPTNAVFAKDGKHVLTTAADASAVVTEVKQVQLELGMWVPGLLLGRHWAAAEPPPGRG